MRRIDTALLSRKGIGDAWHNFCVRQNSERPERVGMQLRILVALTTLLVLLVAAQPSFAAVQIRAAQEPVLAPVRISEPLRELEADTAENLLVRRHAVDAVVRAAEQHAGRMITLELQSPSLRFESLSDAQRQQLERRHGRDAEQWYEQSMGALLSAVVNDARRRNGNLRVSVFGLPVEGRADAAAPINANYAGVLSELDALVSSKSLIVARGANEAAMVENALAEAMRYCDGRPVFYRANSGWRMAVPETSASGPIGHTAQDGLYESALQVVQNDPEVARLLGEHDIVLDETGGAEQDRSAGHDALMQLLAAWGQSDSPWDLNGDGTVDIFDLYILFENWDQYDSQPTAGIARFVYVPSEYTLGSGLDIEVELMDDAPTDPNVVFQVWSNESNSVEAAFPDWEAPFVYPAAALDQVTPGSGEIQALIRNAQDDVVLRLVHPVEFLEDAWGGDSNPDDPSDDPPGDGGTEPPDDDPGGDDGSPPDDDPQDEPGDGGDDDPGDGGDEPGDDPEEPPAGHPWENPLADLEPALADLLQDVTLPQQPVLDNPAEITVRSVADIPRPIGNNKIITIEGEIAIDHPDNGFIFNLGASDVVVRFADGARIRYTGGRSHRGLFQFRSSAARIRIENPVISGPIGTMNTCHAFATMLGDGACSDITICGGEISGVRYTVQGEGGCERFLITGVHSHDNREYFVWGSNGLVDATICHNTVDGVVQEHGIRLAPGVDRVNIVGNDIRIRQEGLLKRTIWIPGAQNVSILDNHTRDGRITVGPDPTANEPGPNGVIVAGNRIEHERNNLAIELFSGARNVLVSRNELTTPHSNWMQVGTQDPFNRPFENIHWTEDNTANGVVRTGFDGIRVSPGFVGAPDIGPVQ